VTDQIVSPPTITYIADVDALEEYEWNADEGRLTMTEQAIEEMKVRAAWRGVVWRGVVWCGVAWRGVVWCGVVWG
jgi:hypothetical protein